MVHCEKKGTPCCGFVDGGLLNYKKDMGFFLALGSCSGLICLFSSKRQVLMLAFNIFS